MATKDKDSGPSRQPVPDNATPGDMLEFDRGLYSHWAIYIGQGKLIHLAMEDSDGVSSPDDVLVRQGNVGKVAGTSQVRVNNVLDDEKRPFPACEVVARAHSKLGSRGYDLVFSNCEHFTTWCRYGEARSKQVEHVQQAIASIGESLKASLAESCNAATDERDKTMAQGLLKLTTAVTEQTDKFIKANTDKQLKRLDNGGHHSSQN